jgi:succinate-semialdehyde dehydrogenase/glutarate-semialdehyde dehydrogenase
MPIASINPATGEHLKEFSVFDDAEIEKRLSRAEKAFKSYRHTTLTERAELLHAVSELLFQETKTFAEIITLEMGKLFRDSVAEIEKCARGCRFYAENGARFLEEEPAQTDAAESYVEYQPLGPVLAVMPWNFPFWQVFRFAAPALMAGNIALLKHAANVPQCALAIEGIFGRAGFEEGVFQALLIDSERTEKLISDPRIKAVTLTGSDRAGSAVGSAAARVIKKSVLELGGNDPFIVMPSADFRNAVATGIKARTINTGQSCIAAKRFFIADEIYDKFLAEFVQGMRKLKIGDPLDETTELGPLATEQILNGVHDQVQKSVAAGARKIRAIPRRRVSWHHNFRFAPRLDYSCQPCSLPRAIRPRTQSRRHHLDRILRTHSCDQIHACTQIPARLRSGWLDHSEFCLSPPLPLLPWTGRNSHPHSGSNAWRPVLSDFRHRSLGWLGYLESSPK